MFEFSVSVGYLNLWTSPSSDESGTDHSRTKSVPRTRSRRHTFSPWPARAGQSVEPGLVQEAKGGGCAVSGRDI